MQLEEARRIALAAQGFCDPPPKGQVTRAHLKRAMKRMALLQLDSVQYVCRSHYLPMFSRLGPYATPRLDDFTYRSDHVFETWAHEASIVAMELEPYLRWHKERSAQTMWKHLRDFAVAHPRYVHDVVNEVEQRGALHAGELTQPHRRKGAWWDGHSMGKMALEYLFRTGELCARRDERFRRVYDLPERILPANVRCLPTPTVHEAHRELLRVAARCLGIGTFHCLADYFRLKAADARPRLKELVEDGSIIPVSVEGWKDKAYLHANARVPKSLDVSTVLSPFDPVVWNRRRVERLFGFQYRIEIYVPKHKREYGYYVLPFLSGDNLKARVEVRANRKDGTLERVNTWFEDGANTPRIRKALSDNLTDLASHLGLALPDETSPVSTDL